MPPLQGSPGQRPPVGLGNPDQAMQATRAGAAAASPAADAGDPALEAPAASRVRPPALPQRRALTHRDDKGACSGGPLRQDSGTHPSGFLRPYVGAGALAAVTFGLGILLGEAPSCKPSDDSSATGAGQAESGTDPSPHSSIGSRRSPEPMAQSMLKRHGEGSHAAAQRTLALPEGAHGIQPSGTAATAPTRDQSAGARGATYVHGIDVSHFQGVVHWETVARGQGATRPRFVFIKKSQGQHFRDPRFPANWHGARQAGLARGAYHVFAPGHDNTGQVNNFLDSLAGDSGELPPVLDLESGILMASEHRDISRGDNVSDIREWLQAVERALGVPPMIYAGHNAMVRYFRSKRPFAEKYRLWAAEYTPAPQPRVPTAWQPWLAWQFSDSGSVPGIVGHVDLSRVRIKDYPLLLRSSSTHNAHASAGH